ncbi:hypothetical protein ACHAQA_002322 [Verticillium albo-atrum]
MAAPKVLVFGALNGALEPAFTKAATLHSKNKFDFAIVTGNLFAESDAETAAYLLNGDITVPIPTYFTVGTTALPSAIIAKIEANEEICENLHFLGKRSVTKTTDGVRIVALGGKLDPEVMGGTSKEQHLPFHTGHDAKTLKGAGKADILLTTVWPAGVSVGSKIPPSSDNQALVSATQEVAELCDALRPRYHFTASPAEFFYEREPFFHLPKEGSDESPVTRFISMAPYGNASKAKAMYAFTLSLGAAALDQPVGTTVSPFAVKAPKRKPLDDAPYSRFADGHDGKRHRGKRGRNRSPPPGPERCFFCLSNPNLSLHMVATIGDDSYLATAKGPLAMPTTFAEHGINFPGHIIITPMAHTPTIADASAESYTATDAQKTFTEMTRFRESLQAMVAAKSSHKLGAITWEISRARNIHSHWQFHPIPAELVQKGLVEAGFRVEAENSKYPALEARDLPTLESQQATGDFFRLWIWADNGDDRIKGTSLVMPLPDGPDAPRFDLQYPRRVVAKLLGLEDRFVWQDCAQNVDEEKADVAAFRDAFLDWDFTQAPPAATEAEKAG